MPHVLIQLIWRRRFSLLWPALGILGADGLLAIAYPAVRDNSELDKTFAGLPPGVHAALGLQAGALTSPAGYLNSQYFANLLPILLLVIAIGLGAWCIGGDEGGGTLELLLSNPVSRLRANRRAGDCSAGFDCSRWVGLGRTCPGDQSEPRLRVRPNPGDHPRHGLLGLSFAAVAFAFGAATGSRGAAISTASAVAVALFMVEGLAEQVKLLRPIREASPWHWLLGTDPIRNGLLWEGWLVPMVLTAVLTLGGTLLFTRRDLR